MSVSGGSDRIANVGEKHDVENVENTLAPHDGNTLTTLDGREVEMTWKTWLVIFVSIAFCCPPYLGEQT